MEIGLKRQLICREKKLSDKNNITYNIILFLSDNFNIFFVNYKTATLKAFYISITLLKNKIFDKTKYLTKQNICIIIAVL